MLVFYADSENFRKAVAELINADFLSDTAYKDKEKAEKNKKNLSF